MKSIVEIFSDIVSACEEGLTIKVSDGNGGFVSQSSPHITYLFGNAQYVKEMLDTYSQANFRQGGDKFPLVVLFTPIEEERNNTKNISCQLSLLIACSSRREWDNEMRLDTSFKNILIPIYDRLMQEIANNKYVECDYKGVFPHTYSENYSYGRFGAYTDTDEQISEPIDAIDIRNLSLTIKKNNCRL